MARLSEAERHRLPNSDFAIPETRAYPIQDRGHAMAALSEVAQHGSPEEQRRVRAAVHARYGMGEENRRPGSSSKRQTP